MKIYYIVPHIRKCIRKVHQKVQWWRSQDLSRSLVHEEGGSPCLVPWELGDFLEKFCISIGRMRKVSSGVSGCWQGLDCTAGAKVGGRR